jgi:hypothetical protein
MDLNFAKWSREQQLGKPVSMDQLAVLYANRHVTAALGGMQGFVGKWAFAVASNAQPDPRLIKPARQVAPDNLKNATALLDVLRKTRNQKGDAIRDQEQLVEELQDASLNAWMAQEERRSNGVPDKGETPGARKARHDLEAMIAGETERRRVAPHADTPVTIRRLAGICSFAMGETVSVKRIRRGERRRFGWPRLPGPEAYASARHGNAQQAWYSYYHCWRVIDLLLGNDDTGPQEPQDWMTPTAWFSVDEAPE